MEWEIFPNPIQQGASFILKIPEILFQKLFIRLYSCSGQLFLKDELEIMDEISLDYRLPSGVWQLSLLTEKEFIGTKKLVVR